MWLTIGISIGFLAGAIFQGIIDDRRDDKRREYEKWLNGRLK